MSKIIIIMIIIIQWIIQTKQANKFISIHNIQSRTNNLRQNKFVEINQIFIQIFSLNWFYGISTIESYLMPNPFLNVQIVLLQTIQFFIFY